jgi:uncharacterized membrane protein (DUF485 family)
MMAKQNISTEYKFPERRAKSTWRKSGATTPPYRATVPTSERKVFVAKKGPTFLNVYVIPVLLLNLALLGWDVISANIAQGWSIYLGYAVILTVSLYLYLAYLDHYLN